MTEESKPRASKTVVLDFEDWRYDAWDFEVDGETYTIEKGGTEVPAEKAEKIQKAAHDNRAERGIVLTKKEKI